MPMQCVNNPVGGYLLRMQCALEEVAWAGVSNHQRALTKCIKDP